MIRVKVNDKAYLFGLSRLNVAKLFEGNPIKFNLTSCGGPDLEIFIVGGESEELIAKDLAEFIGPQTIITETDRFKKAKRSVN